MITLHSGHNVIVREAGCMEGSVQERACAVHPGRIDCKLLYPELSQHPEKAGHGRTILVSQRITIFGRCLSTLRSSAAHTRTSGDAKCVPSRGRTDGKCPTPPGMRGSPPCRITLACSLYETSAPHGARALRRRAPCFRGSRPCNSALADSSYVTGAPHGARAWQRPSQRASVAAVCVRAGNQRSGLCARLLH